MQMRIKDLKHHPKGAKTFIGEDIIFKGWIKTVRAQKNFCFVEINDGSMLGNLQVIINQDVPNYDKILDFATTGASIIVKGTVVESPGKGQDIEVHAKKVALVGPCDPATYPLQKKKHSFEFLRSIAHLRPRTNTFGAVMRVRNALSYATHLFFQSKGFVWLHTPIITASDCEGAGEQFRVTTLDLGSPPRKEDGSVDDAADFFEKPAYLTVSGQLEGEIYALALSNVYTFGPTFRAENSNTSRHLAEFWMIEPEIAFATLKDNMENAEEYIKYVVQYVLDNCEEDINFFDKWISKGVKQRLEDLLKHPFEQASYTFCVRILEKADKKFEYPVGWGKDLQAEHERYLAEEYFKKPVFITDYPKDIKAFYMKMNDDEKTVAAMDLIVPKIGEIIGGSQREDNLQLLEQRIRGMGLDPEDYWWYLELRKYGSVPHSGYGLGLERLVQYVTGMENIRDVIPFPRYPGKAEF